MKALDLIGREIPRPAPHVFSRDLAAAARLGVFEAMALTLRAQIGQHRRIEGLVDMDEHFFQRASRVRYERFVSHDRRARGMGLAILKAGLDVSSNMGSSFFQNRRNRKFHLCFFHRCDDVEGMTHNQDEIEVLSKQPMPMADVDCVFRVLVRPSLLARPDGREFKTADEGSSELVQPNIFGKTKRGDRRAEPDVRQGIVWSLSQ